MPSIKTQELTKQQLRAQVYDGKLNNILTATWNSKVREMRKDATIALARVLITAPILGSSWSYEKTDEAPEGAVDLIKDNFEDLRLSVLQNTMNGWLDFGWCGFEKVFELHNGHYRYRKLKPLLQDITDILIDIDTGTFTGFEQDSGSGPVVIEQEYSLLLSHEPEGAYLYGQAIMGNIEDPYDRSLTVAESNDRYDSRVAGTHWVIHYPVGTTIVNGVETDNFEVAKSILAALESNGRVILPRVRDELAGISGKEGENGWKIELLSDSGTTQTTFIERQRYLDTLKVRGLGLPERSILEGQYGTKAEADAHADFAILNLENKHRTIVRDLNWHAVNSLLRINYGEQYENTVFISPAPLADEALAFLREVYRSILSTPEGFMNELADIDTDALKDRLQIPISVHTDMPGGF